MRQPFSIQRPCDMRVLSLTGTFNVPYTSLSGDLCTDIVDVGDNWWAADCLGNPPEVECPCCTTCCNDTTSLCEVIQDLPLELRCEKEAERDGQNSLLVVISCDTFFVSRKVSDKVNK